MLCTFLRNIHQVNCYQCCVVLPGARPPNVGPDVLFNCIVQCKASFHLEFFSVVHIQVGIKVNNFETLDIRFNTNNGESCYLRNRTLFSFTSHISNALMPLA